MHIAIFGAGSVGGYVGGMMKRAGYQVTLVDAWSQHVEAIQRNGLKLTGTQGDHTIEIDALDLAGVQQLSQRPVDVALLCVKSYDTAWMTTLLKDYLTPEGYVVSLQNGLNEDAIGGIVGWGRVLGCVLSTIGVELTGPGEILRWMKPAAPGYAVFRVGEPHGRSTPRARELVKALGAVDNSTVTPNLWGERWGKLCNNAMASAIGPIAGAGLREIYGDPDLRRLAIRIGAEGVRVGRAMGLQFDQVCGIDAEQWLATTASGAPDYAPLERGLAEFEKRIGEAGQASTLHDLRRGRRTEIDSINGLVAAKAREIGMPAPLNAELTQLTVDVERGRRPQSRQTLAHLLA